MKHVKHKEIFVELHFVTYQFDGYSFLMSILYYIGDQNRGIMRVTASIKYKCINNDQLIFARLIKFRVNRPEIFCCFNSAMS